MNDIHSRVLGLKAVTGHPSLLKLFTLRNLPDTDLFRTGK